MVPVAPYTPSNLTVTPASGTELDLAWREPYSAVTNYNILQLNNGSYGQIAQVPGTSTFYNVTGLNSGGTYSFEVVAANSAGNSAATAPVSGTTPVAPINVSNLNFSNLTTTSVSITWTNNASNATGIDIVRQLESNNSKYLATLSTTATEYDDSGLLPGAAYDYEVTPINLAGPAPGMDIVIETIPTAPSTPTISSAGASITLNWAPYGHAVSQWNIYRGTAAGGESAIAYRTGVTTNSFTDTGLTPGVSYYYTITAVDAGGEGAQSTEVHAAIPSAVAVVLTGPVNYIRLDSDGAMDVYPNTTGTGTPVQYLASSVTVNGTSAASNLIIDFSAGDPLPASGLTANGSTGGMNLTIIGSSGNDTLSVNSTAASFNSTIPINYSNVNLISFNGGLGSDVLTQNAGAAPLNFAGTTLSDTLTINSGTYTFPAPTAGAGIVPVALGTLNIAAGANAVVANAVSHADRDVLQLSAISIAGSAGNWLGTLDLGGNDLDLGTGGLTVASSLAAQGYQSGTWSGKGITSSLAQSDTTHLTALGVILNSTGTAALYGNGSALGPFDGLNPPATDVLIKYTYYGDTNLDGKIDGSDYSRLDSGFLTSKTGWYNGDLNFDSAIDGSDYTLMDNAFNTQRAALSATVAAQVSNTVTRTAAAAKSASQLVGSGTIISMSAPFDISSPPIRSVESWLFDAQSSSDSMHDARTRLTLLE